MTEGPQTQKTIRPKNEYYHFEPNILSNFHLVNFDILVEKVKNLQYIEDKFFSLLTSSSRIANPLITIVHLSMGVLYASVPQK